MSMSHAEGNVVEQPDASKDNYSCGNAAAQGGGESCIMPGMPSRTITL